MIGCLAFSGAEVCWHMRRKKPRKRAPPGLSLGLQKMGRPIVHGRSARTQVSGNSLLPAVTAHRAGNRGRVRQVGNTRSPPFRKVHFAKEFS